MRYAMTSPCDECPFLNTPQMAAGFPLKRLRQFASGEFPCHQTAEDDDEGFFRATAKSQHCAGALIFNEKRNQPHQMARITERLGGYDYAQLNMEANVR